MRAEVPRAVRCPQVTAPSTRRCRRACRFINYHEGYHTVLHKVYITPQVYTEYYSTPYTVGFSRLLLETIVVVPRRDGAAERASLAPVPEE